MWDSVYLWCVPQFSTFFPIQFEELLSQANLLEPTTRSNDFSAGDMSSSERAARHGQLKQLREMKKGIIVKHHNLALAFK